MNKVQLKSKVKDLLTGRTGVVYGTADYVYEASQFLILFNGETKPEWITSTQIEFVSDPTAE